jgi:hypothetical protein
MPDLRRLSIMDKQFPLLHSVTEWHAAAHPHALLLGGGNLVPDTLAYHLALELGEGQKHIQGMPPHLGGGVELLSD